MTDDSPADPARARTPARIHVWRDRRNPRQFITRLFIDGVRTPPKPDAKRWELLRSIRTELTL